MANAYTLEDAKRDVDACSVALLNSMAALEDSGYPQPAILAAVSRLMQAILSQMPEQHAHGVLALLTDGVRDDHAQTPKLSVN